MMSETAAPLHGRLEPGAIGLFSVDESAGLLPVVVLALNEDTASVVPLSAAVQYASEWDLKLDTEILGYPAMAEVWNYGLALPEQCHEVVGHLPGNVLTALVQLSRAARLGGPVPNGVRLGPPVLDEADPRLRFQDSEADLAHALWEPALALAGAATFGELVRHRREELQLAPTELEASGGAAGWLDSVERDAVDLRLALPAQRLVGVLRRLQLRGSSRLRTIARSTLEGTSPQLARRGTDHPDGLPDPEEYLDAVFDELGGGQR